MSENDLHPSLEQPAEDWADQQVETDPDEETEAAAPPPAAQAAEADEGDVIEQAEVVKQDDDYGSE